MEGGNTEKVASIPSSIAPPPFLSKTYDMVDDPSTDALISWSSLSNNSFVVWDPPKFGDLLPKYFKHSNFSSFVRQLNTSLGFRKIDPDRWEFANDGFLRGQKHLLKTISRRKPPHIQNQLHTQQSQNLNSACVEVGMFGLEKEVERLKRDKNVLMQELVRLRQQQQGTDNQLQTMTQRLQVMEQRQQQMVSFLAKAVQSPGFFAQFVQQQSENKRMTECNKKRRIKPDHISKNGSSSDGRQLVKYRSGKTNDMFKKLWDITDPSHSMSVSDKNDNFLVSDVPSSNIPFTEASGAVFCKLAAKSEKPAISESLGCNTITGVVEEQSSLVVSVSKVNQSQKPQNLDLPVETHESASHLHSYLLMDEFPDYPDMALESVGAVTSDELLLGPTSFEADVPIWLDIDCIPAEPDVPIWLDIDCIPAEPDIDYFFTEDEELWHMLNEQSEGMERKLDKALIASNTSSHPAEAGNMDLLTEQMGLLSSDPKEIE